MMVTGSGSVLDLLRWQRDSVIWFFVAATAVWVLHTLDEWSGLQQFFEVSGAVVGAIGSAIGIFVSFRTNSAYDRWWEGRKLWGRLINTSRHFGTQALSFIPDRVVAESLVRRHIAYVHTLRCLLRSQDPFFDGRVREYLTPDEQRGLPGKSNTTHALLHLSHVQFTRYADATGLDERRLQQLDNSILHLLDIQGGCERIKKTPLPRGYGYIAVVLIRFYSVILPFALVKQMGVMSIPMSVSICLAFMLINEVGRVLEDPFTMFWNGLPLFAMSRTIENDLLSRMGHADLEPLPTLDHNGVLM